MAQYKKEIGAMLMRVVEQGLNQGALRKKATNKLGFDELLILQHIHQNEHQPVTRLMDDMPFDRSAFHSALQKFLKAKWVEKHQVEEDKRRVMVKLTEKGKHLLSVEIEALEGGLTYLLRDLTVNEEKGVLKFLSKLHQYIKA